MTMVINSNGTAINYDAAVELMDDYLREEVAADLAPCTEQEFFCRVLQAPRRQIWRTVGTGQEQPHLLTAHFYPAHAGGAFLLPCIRHGAGLFLRLCQLNRPRYQTDKSGYNTICATLEGIHASGHAQQIPDTTAMPGRCTGQRSRLL